MKPSLPPRKKDQQHAVSEPPAEAEADPSSSSSSSATLTLDAADPNSFSKFMEDIKKQEGADKMFKDPEAEAKFKASVENDLLPMLQAMMQGMKSAQEFKNPLTNFGPMAESDPDAQELTEALKKLAAFNAAYAHTFTLPRTDPAPTLRILSPQKDLEQMDLSKTPVPGALLTIEGILDRQGPRKSNLVALEHLRDLLDLIWPQNHPLVQVVYRIVRKWFERTNQARDMSLFQAQYVFGGPSWRYTKEIFNLPNAAREDRPPGTCSCCHGTFPKNKLAACPACKEVDYCSEACKLRDRPFHSTECGTVKMGQQIICGIPTMTMIDCTGGREGMGSMTAIGGMPPAGGLPPGVQGCPMQ